VSLIDVNVTTAITSSIVDIKNIYETMVSVAIAKFRELDQDFTSFNTNNSITIRATSREVEACFGVLKNLLERNRNTRMIILWANLVLRSLPDQATCRGQPGIN
jgi:hypothetical protein